MAHAVPSAMLADERAASSRSIRHPCRVARGDERARSPSSTSWRCAGLAFVEDYVDGESSDVIDMLFGAGIADHAAYAASKPLLHPPGTVWSYSSGVVEHRRPDRRRRAPRCDRAAAPARARRRGAGVPRPAPVRPLGMTDADPRFDEAGTGSPPPTCTPRPGSSPASGSCTSATWMVGEQRILPPGIVDHARTVVGHRPGERARLRRHWWVWPDQPGSVAAHGYEGQYVIVLPEHDAVVVHLGKTDATVRDRLVRGCGS